MRWNSGLRILAVGLLALSMPAPGAQAAPDEELESIKRDLEELKKGQAELRKDLEDIKNLLKGSRQRRAASADTDVVLSIADDPYKGRADAPVTIVEFSDYQCPFCARHFRETFPSLERDFLETGKVKYVFRDFPIERIHPRALQAAVAANCAGEQGKYWPMHDRLFANQKNLGPDDLKDHGKAVGVDLPAFEACLSSDAQTEEIKQDLEEGARAGIRGTPSFFLGLTGADGDELRATRVLRGAQPYARFKKAIENLLSSRKQAEP